MPRISVRVLLLSWLFALFGCGMSDMTDKADHPEGVAQQAVYSGPALKMPLPGGYAWKVNTSAGDTGDIFHTDAKNGYYSIDFGRHVKDNNGNQTSFGDGVVDVLAADSGYVLNTTTYPLITTGCYNTYPNVVAGATYQVHINHGGGYVTTYLHFAANTIGVTAGQWVQQGQVLGKMGNTGYSQGTHLHFQVKHNDSSMSGEPGLQGLTLGDTLFTNYAVDSYFLSTNNFKYTFFQSYGGNPRTCSDPLLIDPFTLQYICNQWSRFNLNRTVYSDLLVESIQQDICLKAEVWMGSLNVQNVPEYCTNGIQPGSGLYFNNANYLTTTVGTGQVRYYARANASGASYLPAPFAVTQFVVLDSNTPDGQPAPVNAAPGNGALVQGPNPSLVWTDASGWTTMDHDLYFWYWNGSTWVGIGGIFGWASNSVTVSGLPTNRYILWMVRSCGFYGCSAWSNQTYFGLLQ